MHQVIILAIHHEGIDAALDIASRRGVLCLEKTGDFRLGPHKRPGERVLLLVRVHVGEIVGGYVSVFRGDLNAVETHNEFGTLKELGVEFWIDGILSGGAAEIETE